MNGRVLVVDDNNLSRMMLSRAVREQGHEVELAPDGRYALELLQQEPFDLVLLDVLMPEMDGYQVLEEMMSKPALRHIPVIMVSALEEMESVIRCVELGAQDYLPKPADPLLLRARINASLSKKRLYDMEALYLAQVEREKKRADDLLNVVIPIGAALSNEQDFGRLLRRILAEAISLCHAAAGVMHLRTHDDGLRVVTARFEGVDDEEATQRAAMAQPRIPIWNETTEEPSKEPLVAYVARADRVINIEDAYSDHPYDFSSLHRLDEEIGSRSRSVLALPLRSGQGRVIGVVQLMNAREASSLQVIPFDTHLEQMMTSLFTLAAVALEHYQRTEQLQREIEVLRIEIDEKRAAKAVAELTETEFFSQLEAKADLLRRRFT